MNRTEFMSILRRRLFGLPPMEIEERLAFYNEMIDDRMEDGMSEEEAVEAIGPIDDIVSQIISEIPLSRIVKDTAMPKRGLRGWEIALLILCAPIWIPLLIASFVVLLSLYLVVWVLVGVLFIVTVSLGVSAIAAIPAAFMWLKSGNFAGSLFFIGSGLICAGLAILFFKLAVLAAKGVIKGTDKFLTSIKSSLIGKECAA
ncbi:MAG: DUF1700 domain-containing protein [Oscillospiraceae bacterium]|nr:DUF1700 domain-containing protein [Oscillospiraceae bacterium]